MAGEKTNGGIVIPYSKTGDKSQDEVMPCLSLFRNIVQHSYISYSLEFDQILLQPFTYLLQVQGKQIRVKLSLAFDYWLIIPPKTLNIINDVVQMLHNASLL